MSGSGRLPFCCYSWRCLFAARGLRCVCANAYVGSLVKECCLSLWRRNHPGLGRTKIMSVSVIQLCWFPAVLRSGRLSEISAFWISAKREWCLPLAFFFRVESKRKVEKCCATGWVGCKEWLAKSLALSPVRSQHSRPSLFGGWPLGVLFRSRTAKQFLWYLGKPPVNVKRMVGPAFAPGTLFEIILKWAVSSMQRRHFFFAHQPQVGKKAPRGILCVR